MQIEFSVYLVGWLRILQREKSRLAVREIELLRIKQRLVSAVRSHWPLQTFVSFKPFVGHSGEQWCQRSNLGVDLGRMLEFPISAETIGDLLYDSPIGPAPLQRLEHFVKSLDAPLGAGERAFLFEAWAGGQNDVRETAGVAKENILNDEEIEFG